MSTQTTTEDGLSAAQNVIEDLIEIHNETEGYVPKRLKNAYNALEDVQTE